MEGLRTTRVVVVDDDPGDGLEILQAMSRLGVGAAYFSGSEDQLPAEKLRGVRLLLLDMDLGTSALDSAVILGKTISVVNRILEVGNGPVLVLAWTSHGTLVDEFRVRLQEARPDLHPLFIILMEKTAVKAEAEGSVIELARIVMERTKSLFPFDLLLRWEEQVHLAANDTVKIVADLIEAPAAGVDTATVEAEWRDGLLRILRALTFAAAGGSMQDGGAARRALFDALNPLHVDCLEQRCLGGLGDLDERASELRGETAFVKDIGKRAILNTPFLVAPISDMERSPCPGSVYLARSWRGRDMYP